MFSCHGSLSATNTLCPASERGACLSIVLLALALGGWWQEARAANPITLDVASPLALSARPFTVAARRGRWFPVAVNVTNKGPAVRGVLTLRLFTSGESEAASAMFQTAVELPTRSAKRLWLYGRLEDEAFDGAEIELSGRDITPLKVAFTIKALAPRTRVVLVVSDSDESLSFLNGAQAIGLANVHDAQGAVLPLPTDGSRTPPAVQPLSVPHTLIPSRWIGFAAVDLLVLQDFPHGALTPPQIEALRGYVAGGGSLLVSGGVDWQRLAKSPLADLWPLVPKKSNVARPAEIDALVRRYVAAASPTAGDRLGGAPVLLTRGLLRPGARHLAGTVAAPLLAARHAGAGRVLFLAFDPSRPPFMGWSGQAEMWSDVLQATARAPRLESLESKTRFSSYFSGYSPFWPPSSVLTEGDTPADNDPTAALLAKLPTTASQWRTPQRSSIIRFLGLYILVLVPLNYGLLRLIKKREWSVVTVPLIVLAFSGFSYTTAVRLKGSALLSRQVTIVHGAADSGVARADAVFWLFSPRKTTYVVHSEDAACAIGDYVKQAATDSRLTDSRVTIRQDAGAGFAVEDAAINMWAARSFVGESVVNLGRGVRARPTRAGPAIINETPFDLKNAVVVGAGQLCGYGDIKVGKTSAPQTRETGDFLSADVFARIKRAMQKPVQRRLPPDELGAAVLDETLKAALGTQFGKTNPGVWLIARSERPVAPLSVRDALPRAQNFTLFVFRLADDVLPPLSGAYPATVRVVDVTPVVANPLVEDDTGLVVTYRCEWPGLADDEGGPDAARWQSLEIQARGSGWTESSYNGAPPGIAIWDFERRRWRPLAAAKSVTAGKGAGARDAPTFIARLPAADIAGLVRRPDHIVRLQVRTASIHTQIEWLRLYAVARRARQRAARGR